QRGAGGQRRHDHRGDGRGGGHAGRGAGDPLPAAARVTERSADYRAPEQVRTVGCVGAGVIGGGWVAYFLARGFRVRAWVPAPDAESRLRTLVDAAWPALTELGLAPGASPANLTVIAELADAVAGADYVQESAPEQLDLKRRLLADID